MTEDRRVVDPAVDEDRPRVPRRGSGPEPSPLPLSIELPERGTGARAARRAAQAASAQRASVEHDVARRLPGLGRLRRGGDAPEAPPDERDPLVAGGGPPPTRPAVGERSRPEPGDTVPVRRGQPTGRWMVGFGAALAVCVLVAAGLVMVGVDTLRDSRTGRTVVTAEPDEPGFEGFLEPTPTLAVRVVHDDALQAAYVLSLGAADVGGGVLLIPADTLVGTGDLGTLALAHAFGGGEENVRGAIEIVAAVGLDEMVTIDDARWAELVAPVAPIRLDNPDALDGFPAGPIELAPEEVGPFLAARGDGESAVAALVRHEVFWEAWLSQLAGAGEAAVPGELGTGLGRFVRGLAAGPHQVRGLPVVEEPREDGGVDYAVDEAARSDLVVTLVPYPRGTANAPRTLVRLLDGTGDPGHVGRVAPQVVASDSSIVVVGNADRFDYETTQIRYHRPEQRTAAERLRRALGAGEVIEDVRPIDSFDVTIVLGTDL
ncbi:MAG: LytR C-terminal domain-containing protein [Acidimicrobiia bacterium]|jgi:hypothetical protein